ncbi:MAG: GreA/GreB family elongation factor, partial [Candidatus Dormibacteraceae bacterium]
RAQLIGDGHGLQAGPGTTVDVEDEEGEIMIYGLVGGIKAEPSRGQVSIDSPVGRALIGHKPGDRIAVEAPAGKIEFTVRAIR